MIVGKETIQIIMEYDEADNIIQEIIDMSNGKHSNKEFIERFPLLTKLRQDLRDELFNNAL